MERQHNEEGEDAEHIESRTKLLPRKWNQKLLPAYQVIAVDETDPDFPEMVVSNPDELPKYPQPDELLHDPRYIRYMRLRLEWFFSYLTYAQRDRACDGLNCAPSFRDFLQELGTFLRRDNKEDSDSIISIRKVLAIKADYEVNPEAALHKLS